MLRTASDYLIFAGIIFAICSVVTILINLVWSHRLLKKDKSLSDKIIYFKGEWNRNNRVRTITPVLCYLVLFVVFASLKIRPAIYILSALLIINYVHINLLSVKYVESELSEK